MPTRRSDSLGYTLASNLSATGAAVAIRGGEYQFSVEGTIGGATVSLQTQSPSGTWSDVSVFNGSKASTTALPFALAGIDLPACNVRLAVSGGAPSGLYAYLNGVG